MTIEQFTEEHRYLNNMYRLENGVISSPDRVIVPTVEHAYQAAKFVVKSCRYEVLNAPSGHLAKRTARYLEQQGEVIRPDWDSVRVDIMRDLVRQKFNNNPHLTAQLLDTGEERLEEGNNWGDRFWGISPPGSVKGENWLGKILMIVRSEFRLALTD
jgi:ribA/ribD-fused uncharacterized protein